jgi:hypothetical protein
VIGSQTAVNNFIYLLDQLTLREGKSVWIEKTPKHFRYIAFIRRFIPSAQIIHMIRDGRDVVASIYDRANSFPDRFSEQSALTYGIGLWNEAVDTSVRYLTDLDTFS